MRVLKSDTTITILIDTKLEANILACCLNWGVSAMSKSKMIDTVKDDEDTRKLCRVENDMWQEFRKVNTCWGNQVESDISFKGIAH